MADEAKRADKTERLPWRQRVRQSLTSKWASRSSTPQPAQAPSADASAPTTNSFVEDAKKVRSPIESKGEVSGRAGLGKEYKSPWLRAQGEFRRLQPESWARLQSMASDQSNASATDLPDRLKQLYNDDLRYVTNAVDVQRYGNRRHIVRAGYYLLALKSATTTASRFEPTGTAAVALPAMFSLLEIALAKSSLDQVVYADIQDVCSKMEVWASREALSMTYRQASAADLFVDAEDALVALYVSILSYKILAAKYFARGSTFATMRTPYASHELSNAKRDIDAKHKTCEGRFEIIKSDKDFQATNEKILDWYTEEDPVDVHLRMRNENEVADTYAFCGDWLLSSPVYKAWDQSTGFQVLWLCGTAGTGKSTVCCRLIEHVRHHGATSNGSSVAFVYCTSKGQSVATSTEAVLNSLIRQLAEVKGSRYLVQPLADFYGEHSHDRKKAARLSRSEQQSLLGRMFALQTPTRIIIDGLDECSDSQSLLKSLSLASMQHAGDLKIFLTSRAGVEVLQHFQPVAIMHTSETLSRQDMEHFVLSQVFSRDDRLLQGGSLELERRLVSALLKRAGGMFIWVKLRLSLLYDYAGSSWRDPLDVEDQIRAIEEGEEVEDDLLNDTYDEIMRRNTGGSHAKANAQRVFQLVLAAFSKLDFADIAAAVAIRDPAASNYHHTSRHEHVDEQYIRRLTYNFLVEADGNVQFAHRSAVDFLYATHRAEPAQRFSLLSCHTMSMEICLHFVRTYMVTLSRDTQILPFLRYAIAWWPLHCATVILASGEAEPIITHLAEDVLGSESWSEAFEVWEWQALGLHRLPASIKGKLLDQMPGIRIASCFVLPQLLRRLLQQAVCADKAVVSRSNCYGECPLPCAGSLRRDLTQRLLEAPFSDRTGQTKSWSTEPDRTVEIVQMLLAHGVDLDSKQEHDYLTRFSISCAKGQLSEQDFCQIMRLLVEHGHSLDATNRRGDTLLHLAIVNQLTEVIDWLCEQGVSTDIQNESGSTARDCAVLYHKPGVSKHLLQMWDRHPSRWDTVVRGEFNHRLADILIYSDESFDTQTDQGRTPVMQAILYVKPAWVHYLVLERQVAVSGVHSPLLSHLAIAAGTVSFEVRRAELLHFLSLSGVDFDTADQSGITPLMIAASRQSVMLVYWLLVMGVSPNAIDNSGRTALHYCVRSTGRLRAHLAGIRMCALLCWAGVDVLHADKRGITALMLLSRSNDSRAYWYIEKKAKVKVAQLAKGQATDLHSRRNTSLTVVEHWRTISPSDDTTFGFQDRIERQYRGPGKEAWLSANTSYNLKVLKAWFEEGKSHAERGDFMLGRSESHLDD